MSNQEWKNMLACPQLGHIDRGYACFLVLLDNIPDTRYRSKSKLQKKKYKNENTNSRK